MKSLLSALILWLLLAMLYAQCSTAHAQGTAFTYQGRLNNGIGAATGSYDLTFSLFNVSTGGSAVAGPLTNSATSVSNGLFLTTLDFDGVFNGANYWLEIGVRTNGNGAFTTLAPRQAVTPTPYAIFAEGASNVLGVVPSSGLGGSYGNAVTLNNSANSFNGSYTGNGGGLTNVNAATLGGIAAASFWQTTGNSGTSAGVNFVGTTDNQPLEFKVNGQRALRLELNTNTNGAPNVVGGSPLNFVATGIVGATIGGGGATNDGSGSAYTNSVSGNFGTVGGGGQNSCSNWYDTVSGGYQNTSSGGGGTVGGGEANSSSGGYATVGGGSFNASSGGQATIGGGQANTSSGSWATVGGGRNNSSSGFYATVGGGDGNSCLGYFDTVGGGKQNNIASDYSAVGGGLGNYVIALGATVGGGQANVIQTNSARSTIGGGLGNIVRYGTGATIGGGSQNYAGYDVTLTGSYSTVGGGNQNAAQGDYSAIPGGYLNWAPGKYSLAAGNRAKANYDGDFVWADSQNADYNSSANDQFCIRALGGVVLDNSTPAINFGSQTRQMLNLFQGGYGIGVQNYTTYFRSGGYFSWFFGGVHNDNQNNPGAGGVETMRLDPAGNLFLKGSVYANAVLNTSDRNVKAGFQSVQPLDILQKVSALPISRWHYTNDVSTPHLGPMAQDFYAAFSVGPDDKHIATIDEEGVALAAIQGLNEKVEVRSQKSEAGIEELKAENAELKTRLEKLEKMILTNKQP